MGADLIEIEVEWWIWPWKISFFPYPKIDSNHRLPFYVQYDFSKIHRIMSITSGKHRNTAPATRRPAKLTLHCLVFEFLRHQNPSHFSNSSMLYLHMCGSSSLLAWYEVMNRCLKNSCWFSSKSARITLPHKPPHWWGEQMIRSGISVLHEIFGGFGGPKRRFPASGASPSPAQTSLSVSIALWSSFVGCRSK